MASRLYAPSSSKGTKRPLSRSSSETKTKRVKTANGEFLTNGTKHNIEGTVKCKFCYQIKPEIVSIPSDAEIECIVLTNDVLANIYTDKLDVISHNITNYSIYDENGHLCSMDSGIMERNVPIYLTGYVKPIYDHDTCIENGIAVKELGPIFEWFLTTYDGGSKVIIGVCTEFADYLLVEPHQNYKKYMTSVIEKIHLSKLVIERILDNQESDDSTYEDVLNSVVNSINPATNIKFTEEDLIAHAQFVLDQVIEYDSTAEYRFPLVDTQCIETLTELSGAVKPTKAPRRRLNIRRRNTVKADISKREFSKATTTELVKNIFENMFAAQLDNDGDKESEEVLQEHVKTVFDDIRLCKYAFKRPPKSNKKIFIVAKQDSSTDLIIGRIEYMFQKNSATMVHIVLFMHGNKTILGDTSDPREIFLLNKCTDININNVIQVVDVTYKKPCKDWFNLGDSKLEDITEPINRQEINTFFFQFQYNDECARFEDIDSSDIDDTMHDPNENKICRNCVKENLEKKSQIPQLLEYVEKKKDLYFFYNFKLLNETYKVGNFIYLQPGIFSKTSRLNFVEHRSFVLNDTKKNKNSPLLKNVDETEYPEYYRKTLENSMRGSNESTPDPFEIGEIIAIYVTKGDKKNIKAIIRRMYRAEQISNDKSLDMNMLFWSDEEFVIGYNDIIAKCYVSHIANIKDPMAWFVGGPDRFYFKTKYDFLTGSIVPEYKLPSKARLVGMEVYVNYNYSYVKEDKIQYIPAHKKINPLRGLDIFAGCGGLSKGLEDSGLLNTEWAIESDDKAAAAFKLNNPNSTVFIEDCNHLLKLAMSGRKTNDKNQKIPQRGEVDFICGGPPCQGFSGMNRFNSGQYSLFKNSLIVSFLSYIDYYRPKFFVMENVRNFVSFNKGMTLRLTLRCITRMGYQCSFGILQAGNFGVPQTRRRLIILAAAPGESLPLYPEPTHVFNKRSSSVNVQIHDKKYRTNCKYDESAPLRTVTVYDAWSDLPEITNGANNEAIPYKHKPITHTQRLLRYPKNSFAESILTDHICKDMAPLVQARIELIPTRDGSDWRDLPNKEVKLSDGTITNILMYNYHDVKNGKGPDGELRGVCDCASGMACSQQYRQNNTIIPWCLPHTANRHNNWAGLYGRLSWSGFCSTTITNPEPMGKQGRVLHPEQHRVVSVRECARSQGFNDSFLFYGPIINKHRQIGNAVPPPMGKAIGHEIIKAISKKSQMYK